MEHPFFTTAAATRAEALRWLSIAEKLLSARDLMGSKSFATRAREADPTLSPADEILAVADTLLAGDRRIGNNQPDFYSVLRLTPPQGGDAEIVAGQYRSLVLLLNPQNNRFPYAEQAFRLVIDAWSVLSNPSRKSLYDKELGFYLHQQQRQPDPFSLPIPASAPAPTPQESFIFAQPQQVHGGVSSSFNPTHYSQAQQVHAQPRVGPNVGGPTRVPQNFMGFHSGSNIVFGSNKPGHEPVNNQGQDNYSSFAGYNVGSSASGATQEQLKNNNTNKEKQPQQDYSNAGDSNNNVHDVNENVEETVEEIIEDDEDEEKEEEKKRDDLPQKNDPLTFWTACPYCYYMYEYPRVYIDCTMRCPNCKRAFQSVVIPSPPPVVDGQDAYFCCWGFIPLGFSVDGYEKSKGPASTTGTNSRRRNSGPWVYIDDDDDDIFADISSSSESDIEWQDDNDRKRKSYSSVGINEAARTPTRRSKKVLADKGKNVDVVSAKTTAADTGKSGKVGGARKQPNRVAKSFGKLDLNVELSNEADEPVNKGNESGQNEDDNIEGSGFFEGLDELFNNLPILNVVGDVKVVKTA